MRSYCRFGAGRPSNERFPLGFKRRRHGQISRGNSVSDGLEHVLLVGRIDFFSPKGPSRGVLDADTRLFIYIFGVVYVRSMNDESFR